MINEIIIKDLSTMPHMLIAGQSGSGKTNFIHNIICSLITSVSSNNLHLMLIDMKGYEFPRYNVIKHLLSECTTSSKKAFDALYDLRKEMEVRNMNPEKDYPHIVMIIDELADLMLDKARQYTERALIDLAQKARSGNNQSN